MRQALLYNCSIHQCIQLGSAGILRDENVFLEIEMCLFKSPRYYRDIVKEEWKTKTTCLIINMLLMKL